jgi:lysophospholipase L1-like esterase
MRRTAAASLALLVLAACSNGSPGGSPAAAAATARPAPTPTPQVVYAAVGASETVGIGTTDPRRQAWPAVLYVTALPSTAIFYNLGIPGETTQAALTDELPEALAVQPTLATVWLNVNDVIAGVAPADYEARLGQLVHALRRGGATRVLVANTPYLDRLPAYLSCRAGTGPNCAQLGHLPTPEELNATVDAYNAATARVTAREGATLVDLHAGGEVPDLHPTWVGVDGFHPSAEGYANIADQFAAAIRS